MNASAAAWPVNEAIAISLRAGQQAGLDGSLPEAVWPAVQAVIAAAEALQLLLNLWQLKAAITPILRAFPWGKESWSTAWKAPSVRPARPLANSMAGLPQVPKSRAARLIFADAAALQASSWSLQSLTLVPARVPEFAALEQSVFWMAHDL